MSRVLVISNECFETKSANGYCLENIVKQMGKENIICDVITFGEISKKDNVSNNITVEYVKSNVYSSTKRNFFLRNIYRCIYKFTYELILPDISIISAKKMYKCLETRCKQNKYDLIISSSGGFVSQIVSLKIAKKMGIRLVPIYLDPPPSKNFLYKKNKLYYNWVIENENEIFKCSDSVVMESNLYNYYSKKYANVKETGIPLLIEHKQPNRNINGKQVFFIGTLWKEIRNPKYAIELLQGKCGMQLSFWGKEDSTKAVLDDLGQTELYSGCLRHEEIPEVMANADYLLNISNVNSIQTPSKLFEYMAYGKPIINIVKDENDKTIDVINKYGNGVSLVEGDEKNYEIVEKFMRTHKSKMDFSEIRNNFEINTPEYTVKIIKEILAKI